MGVLKQREKSRTFIPRGAVHDLGKSVSLAGSHLLKLISSPSPQSVHKSAVCQVVVFQPTTAHIPCIVLSRQLRSRGDTFELDLVILCDPCFRATSQHGYLSRFSERRLAAGVATYSRERSTDRYFLRNICIFTASRGFFVLIRYKVRIENLATAIAYTSELVET